MPDDVEIIDERFKSFVLGNAPLEKLGEGFGWLEGPVWFADQQCLLVSDLPNDRVMRWTRSGGLSVFREPSGFENGHTRDRAGRLVSCSHHGRITRTEVDGRIETLVERFEGRHLKRSQRRRRQIRRNDLVQRSALRSQHRLRRR